MHALDASFVGDDDAAHPQYVVGSGESDCCGDRSAARSDAGGLR
jgi:hypothetical protein